MHDEGGGGGPAGNDAGGGGGGGGGGPRPVVVDLMLELMKARSKPVTITATVAQIAVFVCIEKPPPLPLFPGRKPSLLRRSCSPSSSSSLEYALLRQGGHRNHTTQLANGNEITISCACLNRTWGLKSPAHVLRHCPRRGADMRW